MSTSLFVLGREALVPALQICLTSPEQRGRIPSLDLLAVFPNAAQMLLTLFATKVLWRLMVNLMSTRNLRPFSAFSASFLPVGSQSVLLSIRALHFPLLNCRGWCWPISTACPHLSKWQHTYPVCQPSLPILYQLQTSWKWTLLPPVIFPLWRI